MSSYQNQNYYQYNTPPGYQFNYQGDTSKKKDNTTMYIIIFIVVLIIIVIIVVILLNSGISKNSGNSNEGTGTGTGTGTSSTIVVSNAVYYPGLQWVCYLEYFNDSLTSLTNPANQALYYQQLTQATLLNEQYAVLNNQVFSGNSYNLTSLQTGTTSTNTSGKNAFSNNSGQYYFTVVWYGYFKPNISGEWKFSLNTDDASYLWINSDPTTGIINTSPIKSINNFPSTNLSSTGIVVGASGNALIKNGGIHGATEITQGADFTANMYYPLIIIYGQNLGGYSFSFTVTDPKNKTYSNDLSSIMFNTVSN